jgi:hypothetical protein
MNLEGSKILKSRRTLLGSLGLIGLGGVLAYFFSLSSAKHTELQLDSAPGGYGSGPYNGGRRPD